MRASLVQCKLCYFSIASKSEALGSLCFSQVNSRLFFFSDIYNKLSNQLRHTFLSRHTTDSLVVSFSVGEFAGLNDELKFRV